MSCMKPATREWLLKAEKDYAAARMTLGGTRPSLADVVCFHCQQCVEKLLKARLQEAGVPIPKLHNLDALLNLVLPVEPAWAAWRTALQLMAGYAVDYRYPGAGSAAPEAKQAFADTRRIRLAVRRSFGLKR